MKELTYEDWQKNPTVRMMWVWNSKVTNGSISHRKKSVSSGGSTYF